MGVGYIRIKNPSHSRANHKGLVLRAVLVLEEKLGRPLPNGMEPHHLNSIKIDDRPENLIEISHAEHAKLHMLDKPEFHHFGETHHLAKLTNDDVVGIKKRIRLGYRNTILASMYGVSVKAISHIKSGYRWGHISI